MEEIEVQFAEVTLIFDREGYELFKSRKWHVKRGRNNYLCREGSAFHRDFMGAERGQVVDHINRNTLDNRRVNLRLCTPRQNLQNSRKPLNAKYRFKGVVKRRHPIDRPWYSYIKIDGKLKHLGCFASEEEAARAYDTAAVASFGEFARPNFDNEQPNGGSHS